MFDRNLLWDRLGALSGIVYIALFVVGLSFTPEGDAPSPDEGSAALANYLAGNGDNYKREAGVILAATFFLICFVSYLRCYLQRHEGDDGWIASAAYAGGLIAAGLFLVMGSLGLAQGVAINQGADIQVSSTLYVLSWDFITAVGPPLGLLIGATSVAGIRYGALPGWVSWTGVPIAVLLAAPWVVLVSSVLLVRTWKPAPAPAMHAAANAT